MTLITDLPKFVVFDLETTGVDRDEDRIVTAYVGLMDASGALIGSRSWLLDPGVEIPEGASAVHGISTERARAEGVSPAVAVPEIVALLEGRIDRGTPLVAYNASFDFTMLDRESRRYGGPGFSPDRTFLAIDPFVIDKAIDKYRKGPRKLTVTAAHYGVELIGAHDAEADAVATGRLAWAVLRKLPKAMTLDGLYENQIQWSSEQASGLQEYLRSDRNKNGANAEAVVDGRWPMAPYAQQVFAA